RFPTWAGSCGTRLLHNLQVKSRRETAPARVPVPLTPAVLKLIYYRHSREQNTRRAVTGRLGCPTNSPHSTSGTGTLAGAVGVLQTSESVPPAPISTQGAVRNDGQARRAG